MTRGRSDLRVQPSGAAIPCSIEATTAAGSLSRGRAARGSGPQQRQIAGPCRLSEDLNLIYFEVEADQSQTISA
jgi:hypothetical protein